MAKDKAEINCIAEKFEEGLSVCCCKIKRHLNNFKKKLKKHPRVKALVDKYNKFQKWSLKRPQWYFVRWGKVSLLLVGLYLVIYPFFPSFLYHVFYKNDDFYPYETKLENLEARSEEDEVSKEEENKKEEKKGIPDENRIVIPKIHVDMPIVEGANDSVLDVGIWHRPGTGAPGWGNMVLTGHRVGYAFLPDDVKTSTSFYNLDKLQQGDYVIVYWGGAEYDYEITSHEIVYPADMAVESQDVGERLTLYTCHPVGSNAQRLVYYAQRVIKD